MVKDGSSSFSRASAWPSLTSSLRSAAESAIASTGGFGAISTSADGAVLAVETVSPVLMVSSLPSATISPASAEPRLVSWAPFTPVMPDTREGGPLRGGAAGGLHARAGGGTDTQHPRQRQLAAMLQMHGLKHICQRVL